MADEPLDRETQLLLKEAEWTWSEMEDFVRLVQRYRSLYVTALFVSIGWVLGRALDPGITSSSQAASTPALTQTTEIVLLRLRQRPDIAAVLCVVPMLNAVFFLHMMEAARHLQSLARYRYLLGWKLAHNAGPVWRWEIWKTDAGSVRAWTNPSNIFLGLLALVLTVGCFLFVYPAVQSSTFLFSLWSVSIAFVAGVLGAVGVAGWTRRHKNDVADPPGPEGYDDLFKAAVLVEPASHRPLATVVPQASPPADAVSPPSSGAVSSEGIAAITSRRRARRRGRE